MATQYDTLDVLPNRGGARTTKSRVQSTEFTDGYRQRVVTGLHKTLDDLSFSFSGTYDECYTIEQFLKDRVDTAFYFKFMPQEPLRLYSTDADISLQHDGGLRWTVSSTFSKYLGF